MSDHLRIRNSRVPVGTRAGWTVVELMTVLVISSMLIATLLSVTVGVQHTASHAKANTPYDGSAFAFQRQLQSEFAASRDIYPERKSLAFDGYFQSSERGLQHGPSRVIYEVKEINGSPWLVRRETNLLGMAGERESVQVVCKDFSHFEYDSKLDVSNAPPHFAVSVFKKNVQVDGGSQREDDADTRRWFATVLVRHGGVQ